MVEHDERGELDPIAQEDLFRRGYVHSISLFLVIIALVLGGYYVWARFSTSKDEAALKAAQDMKSDYESAMRQDVYGGKTPEETLNMFVEALEKGDVELASKYFILEQNPQDPDYLTRKKWEDGFLLAKNENRITEIVAVMKNSTRQKMLDNLNESDAKFEMVSGADPIVFINMELNSYSGVWKIESL